MNTRLFMPFFRVSLSHSQSAFSSWEIEITLKKTPIVTGWVIRIQSSIFSGEDTNPRHAEKGFSLKLGSDSCRRLGFDNF
jgi:hypothetical protein